MFNRKKSENTLTPPLPSPRWFAWWLWSGLGTIGLLILLAWAGEDHRAWHESKRGLVHDFTGWVAQVCGGLGRVFNINHGLTLDQRLGFLLSALLVFYLFWRATRAWLAFKPGPVDVQDLIDATPRGELSQPVEDLTAELRKCLSQSSIHEPATLPAEAPAVSFLDLIGDIEVEPRKLGVVLPRLLSRLRPKLAYRVGGVLRVRPQGPDRLGLTVTVTAYVFGGSRSTTVWGDDWHDVIRRSGYWVVSTLLPVTRAGRRPPWRPWWGRELNPELYEAYQNANELSRAGRYPEALSRYYDAIALDPANPFIRGELAETQEKMGLHIEALETCQRALTLDGQTAIQYNKRLWHPLALPHLRGLRYLWRPHRHSESLGLRYRNAIILGTSEKTVAQWYKQSGVSDGRIFNRLIPVLTERYWPAATGLAPDGQEKEWLTSALKDPTRSELVRLVFQIAATQEMTRLAADDSCARLAGLYWISRARNFIQRSAWPFSDARRIINTGEPVTRGAFRVNLEAWAPLRLYLAYQASPMTRIPRMTPQRRLHNILHKNPSVTTFTEADALKKAINKARSRIPLLRRRDWLTHYNSACVHAAAISGPASDGDRKLHVQYALENLEKAVLAPSGGFTKMEWTWMVNEDPDFDSLRDETLFTEFSRTTYPELEAPVELSSSKWPEEQLRDFDYRLLEETAKAMQEVWNTRGKKSSVDIATATGWFHTECDIWTWIHEVTDSSRRSKWQDRVELIRSVQANSRPTSPVMPEFPPSISLDRATPDVRPRIDERLESLERDLERDVEKKDSPYLNSKIGEEVLREATADGVTRLRSRAVRKLCSGYSAAWQTLGEWLARDRSERPFLEALGRVPQPTRQLRSALRDRRKVLI